MPLFGYPSVKRLEKQRKIDKLIEILQDPSNPEKRMKAAAALGRIGSSKAIDPLIVYLKHKDENFQIIVIDALGNIRNNQADDALFNILKEGNEKERIHALKALYKINSQKTRFHATDTCAESWAEELGKAKNYRALAVHMCKYEHHHVDSYLGADLSKDLWFSKRFCAENVLRKAGVEAVDGMIEALEKGENKDINLSRLLAEIGDKRAVPILKRYVDQNKWAGYSSRGDIVVFVKDNS